jgi:hypothetical protein
LTERRLIKKHGNSDTTYSMEDRKYSIAGDKILVINGMKKYKLPGRLLRTLV